MLRYAVIVVSIGASAALGQQMGFEGFAPAGGITNVSPTTPYTEAGFTLTPSNGSSAVFDAANGTDMPGNSNSSFFGWADGNTITLTRNGGGTFSLQSVLLGRSTIVPGPVTINLTGFLFGGGTVNASYPNLLTATLAAPNWTNLTSVEFSCTDDSAMDNIVIPAPSAMAMLGLAGCLATRRRR